MLAFTSYSEAGGVGKTTIAANVAAAEVRADRDVLAIDLDPQDGSLSHLLDVDDERSDGKADNLVRHLVEREDGPFEDLIKTAEGIDIIPAHNMLERLGQFLDRREQEATEFGESWNQNAQLLRVLKEADIPSRYDTLICDPPATAGPHLYNAIHATRSLVIPFEPSAKGSKSVDGLEDLVGGLEENLGIEVGVLAVVPNQYAGTNDQEDMVAEIREKGYDMPVIIGERASMFEGCFRQQCSAFKYVEEHRSRKRDHELETLEQLEELATHLGQQVAEPEVEA